MTIKYLKSEDYNNIINLWEKSIVDTHTFFSKDFIEAAKSKIYNNTLKNMTLYGIDDNQKLVAFIGIEDKEVSMLFVDPNYTRRGYATELMDYAVNMYNVDTITVYEENYDAIKFYRHYGFVKTEYISNTLSTDDYSKWVMRFQK